MTQHKWHKEIKAWADGAEIEWQNKGSYSENAWHICNKPDWHSTNMEYRIKPQPKEPQYLYAYKTENGGIFVSQQKPFEYLQKGYLGKIKLENDDA